MNLITPTKTSFFNLFGFSSLPPGNFFFRGILLIRWDRIKIEDISLCFFFSLHASAPQPVILFNSYQIPKLTQTNETAEHIFLLLQPLIGCSPHPRFSQQRDRLTKTNESPVPQKVGSKVDEGEELQKPKASDASSLMHHSAMWEEPQVAANDGYRSHSIIFHPFKNSLRGRLSKGHCKAELLRLLQKFNVDSWLRLGTMVQNWNLSHGGDQLTEWLLYSLSAGKWKGGICRSLWGILPSIKMVEGKQLTSTPETKPTADFHLPQPWKQKNKKTFKVSAALSSPQRFNKQSFSEEIWLRRIWKCDSMSAGWHLFSLGLLLWGIFIEELTQLRERGNQDGHFSHHNKISATWRRLHRMLIICSNRALIQYSHYHPKGIAVAI